MGFRRMATDSRPPSAAPGRWRRKVSRRGSGVHPNSRGTIHCTRIPAPQPGHYGVGDRLPPAGRCASAPVATTLGPIRGLIFMRHDLTDAPSAPLAGAISRSPGVLADSPGLRAAGAPCAWPCKLRRTMAPESGPPAGWSVTGGVGLPVHVGFVGLRDRRAVPADARHRVARHPRRAHARRAE